MGHASAEFVEMLVPLGATNRTGELIKPTFITIHETSLGTRVEPAYKDVHYYIDKVMNPPKETDFIGYHYLVSDNVIIRFIPDFEYTCHARGGNRASIGIERVVNEGTNFTKAIANQAKLVATLMSKHAIPLPHVVPHKYWYGKECPARLLAGMYGGWEGFIKQVDEFYQEKEFFKELF